MKKALVVIFFLTLLFSVSSLAFAEQTVTTNPIGMLVGVINAQYEMPLQNSSSLLVNGSLLSWGISNESVTGLSAGIGYRKYMDKESEGFFVQGMGEADFITVESGSEKVSGTAAGISGLGGFKWVYGNGFTLELGAGASYIFSAVGDYSGGFAPSLALNLGYTW